MNGEMHVQPAPQELRKFIVVVFACVLASIGAFLVVHTAFAQANNTAIAINTKDNSDVFKLSFKILRVNSDVVAPTNLAFAFSSCNSCQTVAIAIEAVMVMSSPTLAAPSNYAIAYNYSCNQCDTLASAYQYFDTVGGPFRITPQGRQEIAQIRQQLEALRQCDCDILTMESQVVYLTGELQSVLRTQVVPVGKPEATPAANPNPSETPTNSPTAAPSSSPEASPSPSPSSSP